jgi:hypothetical protein
VEAIVNQRRRLFIAQWVQVSEAQWFAPGVYYHHPASDGNPTPERVERHYSIQVMVFPAEDEESAYRKAIEEAENDSDINFDGPGQRNVYHTLGLHELEEYPSAENFGGDLERRGVWITAIDPNDVDATGVPRVRTKDELEIFRLKRPAAGDAATE